MGVVGGEGGRCYATVTGRESGRASGGAGSRGLRGRSGVERRAGRGGT